MKVFRKIHHIASTLIALNMCGCALPSKNKYYQASGPIVDLYDKSILDLAQKYFGNGEQSGTLTSEDDKFYELAPGNDSAARILRNRIIFDLLTISDKLYADFRNKMVFGKARTDTLFKVTDLALTGAAAAIADKGSKTALAAAATFLNGGKNAADANFYANQTIFNLVIVMDGLRAKTRAEIEAGLKKSSSEYDLSQALSAVQEYHQNGSMVSALLELTRVTNTKAQENVDALKGQGGIRAKQ